MNRLVAADDETDSKLSKPRAPYDTLATNRSLYNSTLGCSERAQKYFNAKIMASIAYSYGNTPETIKQTEKPNQMDQQPQ